MDPTETLRRLIAWAENNDQEPADLILALDLWIRKGGFLPAAWTAWNPDSRPKE